MPFGRMIYVVTSFVLLSCVSSDQKEVESNLTEAEQKIVDEYKAEVEIGRNMAGRMLSYYGVYDDEKLVKYLNKIVAYVGSYSDAAERRFMVAILDSDIINAYACPGGYILVTKGALKAAKSEAEIAAVFGHEIAHVVKKHMFNTLMTMREKEREKLAQEVEARETNKAEYVTVRERPEGKESETMKLVARYLGGSAGAGLGFLRAAKAGMNFLLETGLDKKLEYEADAEGVKYAVRAGYRPTALIRYMQRLEKNKKQKKNIAQLQKTHPSLKNRQKRLVSVLKNLGAKEITGADGQDRYLENIKGLK